MKCINIVQEKGKLKVFPRRIRLQEEKLINVCNVMKIILIEDQHSRITILLAWNQAPWGGEGSWAKNGVKQQATPPLPSDFIDFCNVARSETFARKQFYW